tara:strand:- start:873 stop:1427 length:555 start_codon:yes stop_codon:yes gene_type:complete
MTEIKECKIAGLKLFEPKVIKDERGYFMESFNEKTFDKYLEGINFVQDNESKSKFGVLRGLHFQRPPLDQAKLVRVISGKIYDVAIDLRKNSPTYARYECFELSSENKHQLFIPSGFAHGFLVISEKAIVNYKVDKYYSKEHESGIIWNDEIINIKWPINPDKIMVSEKDRRLIRFNKFESCFL